MRVIPEDMIGRVFGVIRLLVLVGMVPGSILGGVVADHWGTRAVMGVSGFLFLAGALSLLRSRAVLSERR
jgi:predicted MFS family arabinose efflux permease